MTATIERFPGSDVNFGPVPPHVDALPHEGVIAYRRDNTRAEQCFKRALAADPKVLPTYFCLYKIHTYHGSLDAAKKIAEAGLAEAAQQAGWSSDWRQWSIGPIDDSGPGRFALYTLKALAFTHLRRDRRRDEYYRRPRASRPARRGRMAGWGRAC